MTGVTIFTQVQSLAAMRNFTGELDLTKNETLNLQTFKIMPRISRSELQQLKRWNTPTIYNGWEQITKANPARDAFNLEETHDFMPQMGPMAGYATTVVIEPSQSRHQSAEAWAAYREYVARAPGPKIAVVQDLDKPNFVGSFWGEVNSGIHLALGCVGTITDGLIRDVDEMTSNGFKALAQRLGVGHAFSCPVKWDVELTAFGQRITPGQLIHADKHGFLAIPPGEEEGLLEAAMFMDRTECETVIQAATGCFGKSSREILQDINRAASQFGADVLKKFGGAGEWGPSQNNREK